MDKEKAIKILSLELSHTESHMRIEGKATDYYLELEQIAEALKIGIQAIRFSIGVDNIADNIGKTKYEAETKGCFNCKYKQRRLTEEPCLLCYGHLSRWEDIKNGKS